MKPILFCLFTFVSFATAAPLVFEGSDGPGHGKHIVFLADDHEYRSEESLPGLARLLAKHQGFKCTVLFGIDPNSGEIVGGDKSNMPGIEALDTAELAVVFCVQPSQKKLKPTCSANKLCFAVASVHS
jgi:hypothetical protein